MMLRLPTKDEFDTIRFALGNITQSPGYRIEGRPQDEYGVHYTDGIIQGGSSGSGLFTLNGAGLELRGILTGTTVRQSGGVSCTNNIDEGLYGRFDIFEPQIDQYIRIAPQAADDAPNRAQDLFTAPITDPNGVDMPLNNRTTPLVLNKRIDYQGDVDIYRFSVTTGTTESPATREPWLPPPRWWRPPRSANSHPSAAETRTSPAFGFESAAKARSCAFG